MSLVRIMMYARIAVIKQRTQGLKLKGKPKRIKIVRTGKMKQSRLSQKKI